MATFLMAQGAEPIELADDETFNKARHRANRAIKMLEDYRNGSISGDDFEPMHLLSFKTQDDDGNIGRIFISPEKLIGFASTDEKDGGE